MAGETTDIASLALKVDATEVKQGAKALDELTAAGNRAATSGGKLAHEYAGLGDASKGTSKSLANAAVDTKKLDAELTGLLSRLNPAYAGLKQLDSGTDLLHRGLKAGMITQAQYTSSLALLESQFAKATVETTKSVFATERARRSMVAFGRDLASGNFTRISSGFVSLGSAVGTSGAAALVAIAAFAAFAAVIGGVTYAAYSAQKELTVMNNALILSGNYAGQTTSSMAGLAQQISATSNLTIGEAQSMAVGLARSGKIGVEAFDSVAAASAAYAKVSGETAEKSAAYVLRVFSDPAKGAKELNDSMHFLSVEQLAYIENMQAQGNKTEAQNEFARLYREELEKHPATLGSIEQAWEDATKAASRYWFAAKGGVGLRTKSTAEQLADVRGEIYSQSLESKSDSMGGLRVEEQRLILLSITEAEKASTEAIKAKRNELDQTAMSYAKSNSDIAKRVELSNKLITMRASEAQAAPGSQQESILRESIKNTEKDLSEVGKKAGVSELKTYEAALQSLQKQIMSLNGETQVQKTTYDTVHGSLKALTSAHKELLLAEAKKADMAKDLKESLAAEAKAEHALFVERGKGIDQLDEEIKKAREHNETIGLSKVQLAALAATREDDTIAITERKLAVAEADSVDASYIETLKIQLEQLRELRDLKRQGAAKEAYAEQAKKAAEEWKKTSETIERSLTDALLRGFEDGKGFAGNFRDTIVNMFKTLVLRPIISAVVSPVAQGITGALGLGGFSGAASAAGGGGGIGGLLNAGSSIASLFGAGPGGFNLAASIGGNIGGGIGGALGGTAGASIGGGFGAAIGTALPYIGAALAAYSLLGGGGSGTYSQTTGWRGVGQFGPGGISGSGYGLSANDGTNYQDYAGDIAGLAGPAGAESALALFNQVRNTVAQGATLLGIQDAAAKLSGAIVPFDVTSASGNYPEVLQKAAAGTADALVKTLIPSIDRFAKTGETLSQTFARLVQTAEQLNLVLPQLESAIAANVRDLPGKLGITALQDYQKNLAVSEYQSPLDRVGAARSQLGDVYAKGIGGDLTSIQAFPQLLQQALTIGRDTFASGSGFQEIFLEGNRMLNDLLSRQQGIQTDILADVPITIQQTSVDQIAEIRKQTLSLVTELRAVKDELTKLREAA